MSSVDAFVAAALGLFVLLPGMFAAVLWCVWFSGPKPRGSFRHHVEVFLGLRRGPLTQLTHPEFEFDLRDADPILPEQEPRKPSSTGERKARGVRARIQRDEIEHALDRMALRAAKAWSESSPDETAKREEAYRLVNVIHSLRKELQAVVSDGEMAAREELLGH